MSSSITVATTTSSPIPSPTQTNNNNNGGGGGPTSSPLLFFVALGFGVVFTNLWIIVGVKYCFRYNQRNRVARALNEHGEPIDLSQMPHQRRRRREKKLMTMEEVNERFPLTKYKIWRSTREAEGLPAAGGVTAPMSRPVSAQDEEATIATTLAKRSIDSARPTTALSMAQQDHVNAVSHTPGQAEPSSSTEKELGKEVTVLERAETVETLVERKQSVVTDLDEDEEDPIRTAAPPEMLAAPGDTCAICLDTLDDDDDVRGLTCGHAFHGSCVDPWFTSRRACCPLCKADYYVPKARPEGEVAAATGRRSRYATMPQQPPMAWMGRRGMMLRPNIFLAGSRNEHVGGETTSRQQDTFYQEPAAERESQNNARTWRDRLPAVSMPRFGRRNRQQQSNGPVEVTTNSDLEAGVR